jgi:hypothetical protein
MRLISFEDQQESRKTKETTCVCHGRENMKVEKKILIASVTVDTAQKTIEPMMAPY